MREPRSVALAACALAWACAAAPVAADTSATSHTCWDCALGPAEVCDAELRSPCLDPVLLPVEDSNRITSVGSVLRQFTGVPPDTGRGLAVDEAGGIVFHDKYAFDLLAGLTSPAVTLPDVPPPPPLFLYRVRGVNCEGTDGQD